MKLIYQPLCAILLITLGACEKKQQPAKAADISELSAELQKEDMPILPVKKGDTWEYKVEVALPEGAIPEGTPGEAVVGVKTRTYLGKIQLDGDYPEVDAFDVKVPGVATERELVDIFDDRILMRGTIHPEIPDAKPIWFEEPIVFVFAGMRPGVDVAKFSVEDGSRERKIQVVGREKIAVEAGEFLAVRLLMTGRDGAFELRKTTWFAPKIGVVKEEKIRYRGDKLIFRETTELVKTSMKIE